MKKTNSYFGNLVDLYSNSIYSAEISVFEGKILSIKKSSVSSDNYIIPGLVDSHIHIESSMLTPQHFARIALSHGTIAVVSDPHEIANVLGIDGVSYMIDNAAGSEMKFFFGAPSCVPATKFESTGSEITTNQIEYLFREKKLLFLSELMNYPGVIYNDEEVWNKINLAAKYHKKIDGHAPGLSGDNLKLYVNAGIDTDHECSSLAEALEKISLGMKIQIREGSAAKNFEALWTLIDKFPEKVFLCSDDLHPDDLLDGHINRLLSRAVQKGVNIFNLLRTVTHNPVNHYNLNVGLLREGDSADFIIVDNLTSFNVRETYIGGRQVYNRRKGLSEVPQQILINNFNAQPITANQLVIAPKSNRVKVISVKDGELTTTFFTALMSGKADLGSDINQDILKLVVLNRYEVQEPALAFIHNFNIKRGAIASSISHDSHNIIAVGVNNKEIAECINWIVSKRGGVAVHTGTEIVGVPLPIAGIISDQNAETLAEKYKELNKIAKEIGCLLEAPFMTLSFMALLVIPELKLSNKGLFDGTKFQFTSLYD